MTHKPPTADPNPQATALAAALPAMPAHARISKTASWGSTLALAYAQAHPAQLKALLLRGVFLFGPDEVDYLFSSGGTYGQNPAAWDCYVDYIRTSSNDWARERTNLLGAYWARLTCDDKATRL